MLGAAALALRVSNNSCNNNNNNNNNNIFYEEDSVALHYRHLAINIVRQLKSGRAMEDILLDRARGYVTSSLDPVSGGVHCVLGGESRRDYVVTSTLASQTPPAVGRALGFSLARTLLGEDYEYFDEVESSKDMPYASPVSFVTVGDGSVHNAHFLSALNMSLYARHRNFRCPVVFGISDNDLSISLKGHGHLGVFMDRLEKGGGIPVFRANGNDMLDVYDKTMQATQHARLRSSPAIVVYQDIVRRFGHASSDRQSAYLSQTEIQAFAESDIISGTILQTVDSHHGLSCSELHDRFMYIGESCVKEFEAASLEPKLTCRQDLVERVSQPMVQVARLPASMMNSSHDINDAKRKSGGKDVMRKHMTGVISEVMDAHKDVVYIGEDVTHGGYYLVTDQLVDKFPSRVCDFAPDETTLLGAAIGFSQEGLTPIVEIPYAKYLDCGADMFFEAIICNWLSNGKSPNGMIIRLQGFGSGKFGGNFHTHNSLHMPPGIDVVCYSNGEDYVRGFRNAILQARNGRIVMLVDCTSLLNERHLCGRDRAWERLYPPPSEVMCFHDIRQYGVGANVAIVSYGEGVVTCLRARKILLETSEVGARDVDIIDCPYLNNVPDGLKEVLREYEYVLFADICKEGQNPLSTMITILQNQDALPKYWRLISAQPTYNPLGNLLTFLSEDDIIGAYKKIKAFNNTRRSD